jgi:hypothetical protein
MPADPRSLTLPTASAAQGVVFEAKILETGETVAIKKVLQDKRFKNRELQVRAPQAHRHCSRVSAPPAQRLKRQRLTRCCRRRRRRRRRPCRSARPLRCRS